MTNNNKYLRNSKKIKNDEFYTLMENIEKEINCNEYIQHFKDKIIYCNCDNPNYSNFFKFFKIHFKEFGIKKLIATYYDEYKKTYKFEYVIENNKEMINKISLYGNGDFRSGECIEILENSDIIVTNPPFSLFYEFITQLNKYRKKFIILGTINCLIYEKIFKMFKNNELFIGHSMHGQHMKFFINNEKEHKEINNIRWFTNLNNFNIKLSNIQLNKSINTNKYLKFDNCKNIININKVSDIPNDYDGFMGVPITFLDKFNYKQFKILDLMNRYFVYDIENRNNFIKMNRSHACNINGKAVFARVVIKKSS